MVVVVLFMLALPGPDSELLKVENDVKAFPFVAWAKISSKAVIPKPNGENTEDVSDELGL